MATLDRYIHTCPQCGLTRDEFSHLHKSIYWPGVFAKHRHLCLGTDDSGRQLHDHCLICGKKNSSMTTDAMYKHYTAKHGQSLNEAHTILDIHREHRPHEYPDLDLNQHYGLLITHQNAVQANKKIAGYWTIFLTAPATIHYEMRDIRDHYREAFFDFFDVDPISLHGHVSDAANPFVLESLLMHMSNVFPNGVAPRAFGKTARLAIMEGSYGMGFGPLAYSAPCSWSSSVACGPEPVIVRMIPDMISQQIKKAKAKKCIALLVAIVRSSDGGVMTANEWLATLQACKEYGMVLVVDEAMTAIRCGAPFAHQLPEYKCHGRPDLILFGKGIRTNGIAVDWQGINLQRLGQVSLEDRLEAITLWQKRFTETAPPEALLQSWGTIVLAQEQEWPQRAIKIGKILRSILTSFNMKNTSISGLHILIWLRRSDPALCKLAVVSANAGEIYTRWLPLMDSVMASEAEMTSKVFGLGSRQYRKLLGAYLIKKDWWLGYCSLCGDAMETGGDREGARERCLKCFVRPCDVCEPGDHVCALMSG